MLNYYKKNILSLSLFLLFFGGISSVFAQPIKDFTTNGSFEDFELDTVSENGLGWSFNITENGAAATFEIVDDAQDGDGKALKVSVGVFNDGDDWHVEAVNENLLVTEGDTYMVSVWLKADTTTRTARFYLGLPESGGWARFGQFDDSLTTEWQKFEMEYTATAADEENTMRFGIPMNFANNENGIIYIDNLEIIGPNPNGSQNSNGSFENSPVTERADTLAVEGWTFELQDTGEATFAIVDDTVKDGNRALRVDVTTQGNNQWSIQAINELFPVEPGIDYTFSAWARTNINGTTANFTVGNPAFNEFGRIGSDQVNLTTEWQEFSFQFQVGANDTVGRAPIHFSFADNVGQSIWIDSVRIQKPIEPEIVLEPMARGKAKWMGNVYSNSQATRFTEYWNQVTPENAGKWGSVEGTRDQMNWGGLDAAYALAKDNGFPFRFHVLIWGNQQPGWMKGLSQEDQLEEIEEWFQAVADRYPDIDYLEVVNEPLHDPPTDQTNDDGSGGYYEALGGAGETGWDWVITSFEMAKEIFPDSVKLMINDYGIVGNISEARNYVEIIKLLKDRDLIDRVGVQAHAFNNGSTQINSTVTPETQKAVLDLIAEETGLLIQATEMDIDGNFARGDSENDQIQLQKYQGIVPAYWEHPSVEGITFWGWRPGLWRDNQQAFIVNENNEHRPAMDWLREYVENSDVMVSNEFESTGDVSPKDFSLSQNYPNPFNPNTQINYNVPGNSNVSISVYDITGRLVQKLVDRQHSSGTYTINFNAAGLSTGVYIYEIRAGSYRDVKKMLLVK